MEFLYQAAIDVARNAHKDQVRKWTGEPYLTHPFAVAGLVASVTSDERVIIAALLHDVIEDSPVRIGTVTGVFGTEIAALVTELTNVSKPEDGNRALRKKLDRERLAEVSVDAKTIKLADIIDNIKCTPDAASEFFVTYMEEQRLLLEVLQEGHPALLKIAESLVSRYFDNK